MYMFRTHVSPMCFPHKGNGVGRCKLATQDKDIIIADAYNGDVFPRDTAAKQAIGVFVCVYTSCVVFFHHLHACHLP